MMNNETASLFLCLPCLLDLGEDRVSPVCPVLPKLFIDHFHQYLYISTMATYDRIAMLQRRLEAKLAQLEALDAALLNTMGSDIFEYRFDDGIGSQRATKHEMREMVKSQQILEAEVEHLINRLSGLGVVEFALRRRG